MALGFAPTQRIVRAQAGRLYIGVDKGVENNIVVVVRDSRMAHVTPAGEVA